MEIVIIAVLAVAVVVLVAFGVWLITPKPGSKGVKIHIDDKAGVKIIQGSDGIHLDIVYETYEDRPADYALFPDIVNDAPANPCSANREFWNDVATLDTLPQKRQEEIANKLAAMGFIRKEDIPSFLNPEAETGEENESPAQAPAHSPNPVQTAPDKQHEPVKEETDGNSYDPENFNTFN